MKKLYCFLSLLLIASMFQIASAQSVLDFKIVNNTGFDLYGVYVSEANTTEWGSDILPKDIVRNGATINVSFNDDGDATCTWDMKLTEDSSETTSVVVYGLNLCGISTVTLWVDDNGEYKYQAD